MASEPAAGAERRRLPEVPHGRAPWRHWGPYLSERAWGTVRDDYSADGTAWEYFPHDHARSRAYRWNEDGLAGVCDDRQTLLPFHEYFHGDTGAGLGASLQTGWTGLVAALVADAARPEEDRSVGS